MTVSSAHLDIPGVGGVLLDAGEGTLGQLRRRYGPEGLKQIYADLKMIFISHMHADHHLGLHAILEDRFRVSY
jgi:ribonuclease Z